MLLVKFSLRVCLRTMWLMDINNNVVGLMVALIIGEIAGIRAEGKSSRVTLPLHSRTVGANTVLSN
jgi:hypothetical protein